jgi:hypothetical protein
MSSTEIPAEPNADIDELRAHCSAFIDRIEPQSRATALARTQLGEMIYWLRVARDREATR